MKSAHVYGCAPQNVLLRLLTLGVKIRDTGRAATGMAAKSKRKEQDHATSTSTRALGS